MRMHLYINVRMPPYFGATHNRVYTCWHSLEPCRHRDERTHVHVAAFNTRSRGLISRHIRRIWGQIKMLVVADVCIGVVQWYTGRRASRYHPMWGFSNNPRSLIGEHWPHSSILEQTFLSWSMTYMAEVKDEIKGTPGHPGRDRLAIDTSSVYLWPHFANFSHGSKDVWDRYGTTNYGRHIT